MTAYFGNLVTRWVPRSKSAGIGTPERSLASATAGVIGRVLVSIEVPAHVIQALERLALLEPGNRDKHAVALAVEWSLEALPGFVSIGDAVWPARLWGEAGGA
jgi:hypothetical protein